MRKEEIRGGWGPFVNRAIHKHPLCILKGTLLYTKLIAHSLVYISPENFRHGVFSPAPCRPQAKVGVETGGVGAGCSAGLVCRWRWCAVRRVPFSRSRRASLSLLSVPCI